MTTPDPLIPVGRDCDCGHPLIWWRGEQRCSVYGRHLPPEFVRIRRDMSAPCAHAVDIIIAATRSSR